jgi:hypothetical protein
MSLLVLTDQDAEPDASSPVTFIAQLMKANHFCFNSILSPRCRGHCCDCGYDRGRKSCSDQK